MLTAILITLAIIALYCFVMWGWIAVVAHLDARMYKRAELQFPVEQAETINRFTFRLGLCGILALGFAGTILAIGGA